MADADGLVGRVLGHFRVLEPIGRGGMGAVFRAVDLRLFRDVALKVLPIELSADGERRARLVREAQLAAAVTHANVATIYEVGIDGGVVYVAMELVRGTTLRAAIGERRGEGWAVGVALGVARGLARAHELGVVHRDLKPENVLLGADGEPKILDFGLARHVGATAPPGPELEATQLGDIKGTLGYLSPEQARGEALDARSDVYALGLLVHELITGRPAFEGTTPMALLSAVLDGPTPTLPEASPALQRIVARCLARRPEDRFPHAGAVRDALDALRAVPSPARNTPRLVGRDDALATLVQRIDDGARTLAIDGPAGIGKTHLATTLGDVLFARETRATVLVPLSRARGEDELFFALAEILDVAMLDRSTLGRTLPAALAERGPVLVVLDGADALEAGALDEVIDAALRAPNVVVLATTRAPLERRGAIERLSLGPLSPAAGAALFWARVRGDESAPPRAVDAIAARFLGRPLSIVLAARKLAALSDEAIVRELAPRTATHDAAPLPTSGLAPELARAAADLTVFYGGIGLTAAAAVLERDPATVAQLFGALRTHGLLRRVAGDRHALDDAAHAALSVELDASGRGPSCRQRHARWFAARARAARTRAFLGLDTEAEAWLLLERENLLAVCDRATAAGTVELAEAARALRPLAWALDARGVSFELRPRAQRLVDRLDELDPAGATDALLALTAVSSERDVPTAISHGRRALDAARALDDAERIADASAELSKARIYAGHLNESLAISEAAAARADRAGEPHLLELANLGRARALLRLGRTEEAGALSGAAIASAEARGAHRVLPTLLVTHASVLMANGDNGAALRLLERAYGVARDGGLALERALAALQLGVALESVQRIDESVRFLEEARATFRARGDLGRVAFTEANLGFVAHGRGALAAACSHYDHALANFESLGDGRHRAVLSGMRGAVLAEIGRVEAARADLEAATSLAAGLDDPPLAEAVALLAHHLDLAQARVGNDPAEQERVAALIHQRIAAAFEVGGQARRSEITRAAAQSLDWVMQREPRRQA